nr:MAG TPA: hypothetical protein [Caudoviricetes sp.]
MTKNRSVRIKYFCKDCAHAREFHSMSLLNEPILCKCDFQRHSMLLNHDCCEYFKHKL